MTIINATEARAKLYALINLAGESHEPIVITGKKGNAVLVSEEDWNSIQETLHIKSIPGLDDDIKRGLDEPLDECADNLDW